MNNLAVTLECEWLADGSLRLRFLNHKKKILGQQILAAVGVNALHLLVSLAFLRNTNADPETVLEMFQKAGLDVDLSVVTALMESQDSVQNQRPMGSMGSTRLEREILLNERLGDCLM